MIANLRERIRSAQRVVAFTGAGVSAESGIPTFRGAGGLWRNFRAEELATPAAFERDPRLVWEWYDARRQSIAAAQPNPAHSALSQMETCCEDFTLISQNVDDLHERAGSRNLLKVHGNIFELRCTRCGETRVELRTPLPDLPPRCACGGLERPGVVWFGEVLPNKVWEKAEHAASQADIFLVIGTSAVVYPSAGLVATARRAGAKIVEINVQHSAVSDQAFAFLEGPAGELLPQLIA